MNSLPSKADLIRLVESTNQEQVLKAVLAFFKDALNRQEAPVWQSLSQVEKQEVLNAYPESEDETKLISLEKGFEKLN